MHVAVKIPKGRPQSRVSYVTYEESSIGDYNFYWLSEPFKLNVNGYLTQTSFVFSANPYVAGNYALYAANWNDGRLFGGFEVAEPAPKMTSRYIRRIFWNEAIVPNSTVVSKDFTPKFNPEKCFKQMGFELLDINSFELDRRCFSVDVLDLVKAAPDCCYKNMPQLSDALLDAGFEDMRIIELLRLDESKAPIIVHSMICSRILCRSKIDLHSHVKEIIESNNFRKV